MILALHRLVKDLLGRIVSTLGHTFKNNTKKSYKDITRDAMTATIIELQRQLIRVLQAVVLPGVLWNFVKLRTVSDESGRVLWQRWRNSHNAWLSLLPQVQAP
jgi:hypothetical protein